MSLRLAYRVAQVGDAAVERHGHDGDELRHAMFLSLCTADLPEHLAGISGAESGLAEPVPRRRRSMSGDHAH